MTTHTIQIEGLPEGWEAVAYRYPKEDENVLLEGKIRQASSVNRNYEQLIVQKTKPRRILLEEIPTFKGKPNYKYFDNKLWREVREE